MPPVWRAFWLFIVGFGCVWLFVSFAVWCLFFWFVGSVVWIAVGALVLGLRFVVGCLIL